MMRHIAAILVIILSVVVQTSVLPMARLSATVQFPLVVLVLLGGRENTQSFFWYALLAGFLLDVYAGIPFGVVTVSTVLLAHVHHLLFARFFTNRSIYATCLLMASMTIGMTLLLLASQWLLPLLGQPLINAVDVMRLPWMLLGNTVAVFVLAMLVHLVGRSVGASFLRPSTSR